MTFSKLGTDKETGQLVYLPKAARLQGLYIIGIQGTGKSGLIENLIMQDIKQQIGVCVLDPHGELIEHVIARLPGKAEEEKVVLFDITDEDYPFGLNLFTCSNPKSPKAVQEVVDQIMHIFEKLLGVSHDTPLILQYLRNCTYTLIANPSYTMAEIPLLLTDKQCRQHLVAHVKRMQTRLFWQQYEQMKPSEQIEQMASIQRRVDDFLQDLIVPIVGQAQTSIDLQKIMDEGKILLVKLSPQLDSVSSLIGSLFIALLLNAAYARPTNKRRQFHLYADEFERFATEDFATLLEQARKFGIATTIAHQNRGQLNSANSKLETDLKDRSRSVGNMMVFRVNSKDADDLAGEFKITPHEARLEVLKEEWHDRIEEAVEDGEEEIKTRVKDVVGHLLRAGEHPNPVVNEFVTSVLHKLRAIEITPQEEQSWSELNRLFYQAMTGKPIEDLVPSKELLGLFLSRLGFGFYSVVLYDWHPHGSYWATPEYVEQLVPGVYDAFLAFWQARNGSKKQQQALAIIDNAVQDMIRDRMLDDLHRKLEYVVQSYNKYMDLWEPREESISNWGTDTKLSYEEWSKHRRNEGIKRLIGKPVLNSYRFQEIWHQIRLDEIEVEQLDNPYYVSWETILSNNPQYIYKLIPGQETKFYREADLQRAVAKEQQKERTVFLTVVTGLKQTMQALADEPIMVGSGLYRPRPRKQIHYLPHARETLTHPQRPFKDVKDEIAAQLVNLPNFTTRVKIATANGTAEHTIKTLEPEKGLYGKALQERIARIQVQNRRDGYTRARADIEAEIIQRQLSCCGSAPAQPQQPSPQQQARHARQVPVQGKCPTCGASNTPGSRFCNQCGTKL